MKITPATVYLTDNGAAYCGDHLGATAQATGLDISGQEIYAIRPEDLSYPGADMIQCEQPGCGRRPSRVWS